MRKNCSRALAVLLSFAMIVSLCTVSLAVTDTGITIISDPASPAIGDTVTLSVSASSDLDLTNAAYAWSYASSDSESTALGTDAAYVFDLSADTVGTYTCVVTIGEASYSASISIAAPDSTDADETTDDDSGGSSDDSGGGGQTGDGAPSSAAIYVDEDGLSDDAYSDADYTVADGASGVSASGADGISLTSDSYSANGIVATGDGVNFTLGGETGYYTVDGDRYNSVIQFAATDGNLDSDGAGTAVDDGATMNIINSYIQVDGAGRYTVSNYNDGTLVINDSTIVATGKSQTDYTDSVSDPFSNAALLVSGTSRANFSIGQSQTYYINSSCIAEGWAAMSTDSATNSGLDLYSYNSYAESTNGGYGTYADTNCRVWLYGSDITGGELGAIISNNGTITVADGASAPDKVTDKVLGNTNDGGTILAGGRNGVQIHSPDMMGSGASDAQTATFTVENSTVAAEASLITDSALDYADTYGDAIGAYVDYISGSAILVKSTSANINLTNATLETYNDTLVQTVLNSDSMGRFLDAGDNDAVDPVTVNMTDMSASGDIRHEDYQRDMEVNLDDATLTGAIIKGTYDSWTAQWADYGNDAANWNPDASWDGTNNLDVTLEDGSTWTVTGTSTLTSLKVSLDSTLNAIITSYGTITLNADGSYSYTDVTLDPVAGSSITVSNEKLDTGTVTLQVNGSSVTRNTYTGSLTSYKNRTDTYIFGLQFVNGALSTDTSVLSDVADLSESDGSFVISGLALNIDEVSGFTSVVADSSSVTVDGAAIYNDGSDSDGTDASDFTAINSTFTAVNGGTLDISDTTVVTHGFLRSGFIADGSSEITITNSNFTTYGADDSFDTDIANSANQSEMVTPPWVLGIYGSARTGNLLGDYPTLNVIDSTMTTGGWAVLSVDACTSPVINAVDSTLKAVTYDEGGMDYGEDIFGYDRSYGSGYGSYFIGSPYEYFYGVTFDGLTYAGIYTGGTGVYQSSNGTISLLDASETTPSGVTDGSTVVGNGSNTVINTVFGFMTHGAADISVLDGTEVNTEDATFLLKAGTVDITVDDAALNPNNGVLVQMMDNDDSVVGMADGATQTFNTSFTEKAGWPGLDEAVGVAPADSGVTAVGAADSVTLANTAPGAGGGSGTTVQAITLTNGDYSGDLYNGTGYVGTAKELDVTIGAGATLDGAISATTFIHSSDGGQTQNTYFNIEQYYLLGHVVNRPYYNGSNTVSVSLTDDAVWTVEPAGIYDEAAILTSLTIGSGASVQAPEGYTLTVTKDGTNITLEAGQTYTGTIVLTVSKNAASGDTVVIADDGSITLNSEAYTAADGKLVTVTDADGVEVTGVPGTYVGAVITETDPISSSYNYRAALYVDGSGVEESQSVLSGLVGGTYSNSSVSGSSIVSQGEAFNGIFVDGAAYDISDVNISMTGNGANDFVGYGTAILAAGSSEVTIDGSTVENQGVVRTTVVAMGSAKLLVMNSTLSSADGTQDDDYVGTVSTSSMKSVPWMLGLNGNARATNLLGAAQATYFNSTVTAEKWGVLSTDENSGVSLYSINSDIYISGGMKDVDTIESLAASGSYDFYNSSIGRGYLGEAVYPFGSSDSPSGYATYSIGATQVIFAGSTIVAPTYIGVCANGASGITLTSSDSGNISSAYGYDTISSSVVDTVTKAYSERFGIMYHSGAGSGTTYVNDGTELYTGETTFLIKGCGTNIDVDDAVLSSGTGVILQVIDNDDAGIEVSNGVMSTTAPYTETHGSGDTNSTDGTADGGVTANFSDMTLSGDMFNSSGYEGATEASGEGDLAGGGSSTTDLTVNLTNVTYTGVISTSESWHNNYSDVDTKSINPEDYDYISSKTDTVSAPAYAEVVVNLVNTTWTVDKTGYLTALEIDADSTINGVVYVNGTKTVPQAGVLYTGVITVEKSGSENVETGTYTVTLVPSDDVLQSGDTLTVNVVITSDDYDTVAAYQADISYDPSLLTLSDASGINGFDYKNNASSGVVRISSYGEDQALGNGLVVAVLTFTVPDDAASEQTTTLTLSNLTVSDTSTASSESSTAQSGGTVTLYINKTGYGITFIDYDTYNAAPTDQKVMLVKVFSPADGITYYYNGTAMYYSSMYLAYVTIVDADTTADEAEALITAVSGTDLVVSYDGDVTQNNVVNINDAQMVYNFYTQKSISTTVTILQRLEADVNGDGTVDSADARAIQVIILNQNS